MEGETNLQNPFLGSAVEETWDVRAEVATSHDPEGETQRPVMGLMVPIFSMLLGFAGVSEEDVEFVLRETRAMTQLAFDSPYRRS